MSLAGKIAKLLLPLAAAGLIGCSSIGTKRDADKIKINFGVPCGYSLGAATMHNPPHALEKEAADPYMTFNGERIDTTTTPRIHTYSVPSTGLFWGLHGDLYVEAEYQNFFIRPLLMFSAGGWREEYQAPEPHIPLSYYDIRYVVSHGMRMYPLAISAGYNFPNLLNIDKRKLDGNLMLIPTISLSYGRIAKYEIAQGIESYNEYHRERLLASGTGNMFSLDLSMFFSPIPEFGGRFGLTYNFGDISFKHDSHSMFNNVSLTLELLLKFGFDFKIK